VDDLAKFITSLNAGPVYLVGRSGGGGLAMRVAVKNPALVRTLIVHEPALMSVLSEDSEEGKAARSDQAKVSSAAMAANKAGDSIQAVRLFMEGVYHSNQADSIACRTRCGRCCSTTLEPRR
jgi:pimeloyl-ACP methyl ester carboxylesterase